MRMRFANSPFPSQEDTRKVKTQTTGQTVEVMADGEGLISHVIKTIDADLLEAIRGARATARGQAWDAGARPETITLSIDATLLGASSEKEGAAGNYKGGFGFHPLLCYLDETGKPLAAVLRPGNAGATPPPITSRFCSWRSSSCPRPTGAVRSWSAPTSVAEPTPSPRTAATPASASRSATRSTQGSARRSSLCPNRHGRARSTVRESSATAPG